MNAERDSAILVGEDENSDANDLCRSLTLIIQMV